MKNRTFRRILFTLFLAGSLFLGACTDQAKSTTAPDATLDTGPIYTQAAQTIEAGMQLTEAARPTATITSTNLPTSMPLPTKEPSATNTTEPASGDQATATATNTPVVVAATATNTSSVLVIPTATSGSTTGGVFITVTPPVNKADLISLSPGRGIKVQKNAIWDMTVTVKNTGGFTWKQFAYALRYSRGETMGSPSEFLIQKDVKPGENYNFVFSMQAPDTTGPKQIYWEFSGEEQVLMYVDFNIEVID